jgi:uncharacterized damage-inducible protein DinB
MTPAELLIDGFERVLEGTTGVVSDLSDDELVARVSPDANTIAWLAWHIARGQDAQVADVAGTEQVWISQGFADRFSLQLDNSATGYGMSTEEVGRVRASAANLVAYLEASHEATVAYLKTLSEGDLDRVVDERWTPPVTLGVRLMSVLEDDAQHLGQARYARGALGF